MKLDCHIHARVDSKYGDIRHYDQQAFLADLRAGGMDGAAIYSLNPVKYASMPVEERMEYALTVCRGKENLFPFYWIHPLDEDAADQVDLAVEKGFAAFKMIPSTYHPACKQSIDIIEKIAKTGKPIMFHSGICWDGVNSANNHKPANYEALIGIPGLRFCLAHVSWPWYDECIAVYGKFNNAYYTRPEISSEMFIDVTPGTPRVFREEVFRHLLCSDYELRYNLMFGTDSSTGDYNAAWCREWQERDNALYEAFIPEDVEDFKAHVYGKNLLRFLGLSDEKAVRKIPMVGQ